MTITFGYAFNEAFVIDLVEGVALIIAYSMFIFSAGNQPRENKSYQLLRYAGIFGILLAILPIAFPRIDCLSCTFSELYTAMIYVFSIELISVVPNLVCLGVSLYILGKRNEVIYGKILTISGELWIIAFIGYLLGNYEFSHIFSSFNIMFLFLYYFIIPAFILMTMHGLKFRDGFFILAAFFFICSWSAIFWVPWLPLHLI